MDITSIVGPIFAFGCIITGLIMEGGHLEKEFEVTAILIVFGGTFGALMVAYPMPDIISAFKALGIYLKNPAANPSVIMAEILDCATVARKESILALEKSASRFPINHCKWPLVLPSTVPRQRSLEIR